MRAWCFWAAMTGLCLVVTAFVLLGAPLFATRMDGVQTARR